MTAVFGTFRGKLLKFLGSPRSAGVTKKAITVPMGHKSANFARFMQIGVKKFVFARISFILDLTMLWRT